jgi:hypothetical protein
MCKFANVQMGKWVDGQMSKNVDSSRQLPGKFLVYKIKNFELEFADMHS